MDLNLSYISFLFSDEVDLTPEQLSQLVGSIVVAKQGDRIHLKLEKLLDGDHPLYDNVHQLISDIRIGPELFSHLKGPGGLDDSHFLQTGERCDLGSVTSRVVLSEVEHQSKQFITPEDALTALQALARQDRQGAPTIKITIGSPSFYNLFRRIIHQINRK